MTSSNAFALTTTFKITGRLKYAYDIKEGETVSSYDDCLIVTNKNEDKSELFRRLLKYGNLCEILYPKTDRENFKNLVYSLINRFELNWKQI